MRLFIAIDLPEEVKEYLSEIQEFFGVKETGDFHITLKFLGECDEAKRIKVEEVLAKIKFKSFEASLDKAGTFRGGRVLWISLKVPEWLDDTVNEIEDALSKLGFQKENRFVPHITLARANSEQDSDNFQKRADQCVVKPLSFDVESFCLFESKLSKQGATHIKLREFGAS